MSEFKLKQIAYLLWHSMMLVKASSGFDINSGTIEAGEYHFQFDFDNGEVTICEAKKTINLER